MNLHPTVAQNFPSSNVLVTRGPLKARGTFLLRRRRAYLRSSPPDDDSSEPRLEIKKGLRQTSCRADLSLIPRRSPNLSFPAV